MTARKYILYKHTAPNGKVYIGITCKTPAARWGPNGNGYKLSPHFWKAICKYGWDNLTHEILLFGLTKEEACEKEREYIKKYRSNEQKYGYNMTSGGEGGFVFVDDVRKKLSSRSKEQWGRLTQEERAAISERAREVSAKRTAKETREIRDRAKKTIRERYTPEQIAERYKKAVKSGVATKIAKYGCGMSPEQRAASSERMKKYWEEYRRLHPKAEKKKRYYPPRVKVRLSKSEALKLKWQDPEFREKQRIAALTKKPGAHHKHTEETRAKMMKPKSEETKAKMRKPKSEETKAKMRKPKSMETRRKMSEAKRRYVESLTPEQRKIRFGTRKRKEKTI